MQGRESIEQQIREFHQKAMGKPGEQGGPVVAFGYALLAAQMQILLLKADFDQQGEKRGREAE